MITFTIATNVHIKSGISFETRLNLNYNIGQLYMASAF